MRGRLAVQIAASLAIAGAAYTIASAIDDDPAPAELIVVQDVPADVRAELDATWQLFVGRFPARRTCFSDVSVVLVADVDGGDARYVPDGARIEIAIPTTPARFRESVTHELAHHLERTCAAFAPLRKSLQPALGEGEWFVGERWEEVPSERFAEAVVQLVNGERIRHVDRVEVDPGVVETIARWGSGESDRN